MKTLIIEDTNNDVYIYSGSLVERVAVKHVNVSNFQKIISLTYYQII